MNFYIKNKSTNKYFAGFGMSGEVLWGGENSSKPFETSLEAECQASLLICHGEPVQRKPVAQ